MFKNKFFIVLLVFLAFLHLAIADIIYVSQAKGNNKNPGTKDKPLKEIDKAIAMAKTGDEIHIAGGVYSGTFGIGYLETDKPLKIFASYDESFSKQDIVKTPTLFQPDNDSGAKSRKAMLRFTKDVSGTVIDNMVFDMGYRNAYSTKEGLIKGLETGRMLRSTERPPVGNSTVEEPIIQVLSAARGGDITIQNNAFINGSSFAIQIGHRSGKVRILNNVFVANRMAAIEVYGTCANKAGPKDLSLCGDVEIANNTILFTWSRLKDMSDMGYGIRVMTKCNYSIANNIIGGSVLAGIDNTRFNKDEWLKIEDNIFFVNKKADLEYSPASNTKLNLFVDQFDDLSFASVKGNSQAIPKSLKINKTYLEAFLNVNYTEKIDFDANSPANLWREAMGLNKQGKIASNVSMFMNRYPYQEALLLFGAVPGYGAQK